MNKQIIGRTFFFNSSNGDQVAVHHTKDNHWTCQIYSKGVKMTKMQRVRFEDVLSITHKTEDEIKTMFCL